MCTTRRLAGLSLATAAILATGCSADLTPDSEQSSGPTRTESGLTVAEESRYLREMGEGLRVSFPISDTPESVEVRRWIKPEEADRVSRECINDNGFPMNPDGSFSMGEQSEAYWRTWYECTMAYPVIPKYTAPWGSQQVEAQYDWTTEYLIPCLESHGVMVRDVPTREVFAATWEVDPYYPWTYVSGTLSGAEELELEYACPQIAPADVLWEGVAVPSFAPPSS